MEKRGSPAFVAEFIGTFALVWSIILAVSMYGLQGDIAPRALQYPFVAMAHALVLFLMIQTLGRVSGGHFNPAVTIALASTRKIAVPDAAKYVIVQVIAAIAAAGLAYLSIQELAGPFNYAAPAVSSDIQYGSAFLLEALATFFLVWAVVGVAVDEEADHAWAPVSIGLTLGLGVLLIGGFTGGSLNPARAIGPALISGEWGGAGTFLLVYILAPVLGGLLAAITFDGVFIKGKGSTIEDALTSHAATAVPAEDAPPENGGDDSGFE